MKMPSSMTHVFILFCALFIRCSYTASPNIVFILTDDQDVVLGGMTPLAKAKRLIGSAGITFENMFVTSPLCCPSRSSILTGRYVHNHLTLNNSLTGNCSSTGWQNGPEKETFATHLKKRGYTTFFSGKYLNQYGKKSVGGVEHVPPGWDHWYGLVGNSVYYNYTLSVNGKKEVHKDNYNKDYLTDLIGRHAEKFLNDRNSFSDPFFMMLSTPAPHSPFTPAPQYKTNYTTNKAPRDGSFNKNGKDKHWIIRKAPNPMSKTSVTYIDNTFRDRWRTLLSVDDLVENVVNLLKEKNILDNTYVFFSSDNGFHLGQFSMPNDKRHLYEFDIRVPLMVRGPGIKAGQVRKEPILNIDLAPTFVALSGDKAPEVMDGMNIDPLLKSDKPSTTWREDFLVEHSGEAKTINPGCPHLTNAGVGNCFPDCVCEDATNNTYSCVRTLTDAKQLMYCEFSDRESFVEVYDMKKDVHQLTNVRQTIDKKILIQQNKRLIKLSICKGATCRTKPEPIPAWEGGGTDTTLRFKPKLM